MAQHRDLAVLTKVDTADGFHQVDIDLEFLESLSVPIRPLVLRSEPWSQPISGPVTLGLPDRPAAYYPDLLYADAGVNSISINMLSVPDNAELCVLQSTRNDTSGTLKFLQNNKAGPKGLM